MEIRDAASVSRRGAGRTANQDGVLVWDQGRVCAVADGLGGAGVGNVASSRVLMALRQHVLDVDRCAAAADADPSSEQRLALHQALDELYVRLHDDLTGARERLGQPKLGASLLTAVVSGGHLTIGQVGDCRAYVYRDGRLRLVSVDQTLGMLQVRAGRMTTEQLATSPLRARLWQALGRATKLDVATSEIAIADDDVIVLCSNGVHHALDERAMEAALDGAGDMQEAAEALVGAAEAQETGDDASVVAVRVSTGTDAAFLDDVARILRKLFLFRELDDAERHVVAPFLEHELLEPGEVLFLAGEPGDAFYVVVDGQVAITRGQTHLVDIGRGGHFGELALTRPAPRSATATAVSETIVFSLSRERFGELMQRRPSIGARISLAALDFVGDRLRDLTERIERVERLASGEESAPGLPIREAIARAAAGTLSH